MNAIWRKVFHVCPWYNMNIYNAKEMNVEYDYTL